MSIKKKNDNITFKTIEEYRQYYASPSEDKQSKGNKYYRMGEAIAKMACQSAVNKLANSSLT